MTENRMATGLAHPLLSLPFLWEAQRDYRQKSFDLREETQTDFQAYNTEVRKSFKYNVYSMPLVLANRIMVIFLQRHGDITGTIELKLNFTTYNFTFFVLLLCCRFFNIPANTWADVQHSKPVFPTGQSTKKCLTDQSESGDSRQLDLDYCTCEEDFQHSIIIKRLSLKRRPRVAGNDVEKTQTGNKSSQWRSAEPLSSSSSDDTRRLGMSSSTTGRPPLPPSHGSSSDKNLSRGEGPKGSQVPTESKPQPTTRSLASHRQGATLEKTNVETHQHVEQEVTRPPPPQPSPRRRLASFGGVSSPGSVSPFTGLGAYSQSNHGNKPSGTGPDMAVHLRPSLGSTGSTGCLRLSPQSSGRNTPVTGYGPVHLQNVRDQMVVALQRLKELEEQVKLIPILQVKVSVLQEEKRQLASQLKNQSDNEENGDEVWRTETNVDMEERRKNTDFGDQPIDEVQALERQAEDGRLLVSQGKSYSPGSDIETKLSKTRSTATQVCDGHLGIHPEHETDNDDAQQLLIFTLKERICYLEAELKESALQTEMSRLKLEIHAAGARNRVDKASDARPSTASTGTEARPHTTSQGVGNHTEVRNAGTGEHVEVKSVGVSSCQPELKNVSIGPELHMSRWEVRERVETREKGVGIHIFTNTQGVETKINVRDAGTNTEMEMTREKTEFCSVACGDCSVDVVVREAKQMVSQGTATDPIKGMELGVVASPETVSNCTNTRLTSVSRYTNTRQAFLSDSSTNTVSNAQDKHTNTPQAATRNVSVGNRVTEPKRTPETRTVSVGTENMLKLRPVSKIMRDTGVGFTNIYDNFLVGMKTRNMASGPSYLLDPVKTRSIGVGDGRVRDLSAPSQGAQQHTQSQWDSELNHYIEKMQQILGEHGGLLTEDCTEQGEGPASSARNNKAAAQGGIEVHPLDCQPPGSMHRLSSTNTY